MCERHAWAVGVFEQTWHAWLSWLLACLTLTRGGTIFVRCNKITCEGFGRLCGHVRWVGKAGWVLYIYILLGAGSDSIRLALLLGRLTAGYGWGL